MRGLVLSGGGARGAYQIGVLKAVAEIAAKGGEQNPFRIITGISAGAINSVGLAGDADQFQMAVERVVQLWATLSPDQVFKTDPVSVGRIGLQWMRELSLGGLTGTSTHGKSLLDTAPLLNLIRGQMNEAKIEEQIRKGTLHALAVSGIDLRNSFTVTFVQGHESIPLWERERRIAEKTKIRAEHILASSAIPLLFPAVAVDHRYFADGCIRNHAPCSAAIHLGADSLFVIGVQSKGLNYAEKTAALRAAAPSVARVANVLLGSVMLDAVDVDIQRLDRINNFLKMVPEAYHDQVNFKPVPFVFVSPSQDIGLMASRKSARLPRVVRYLLKGLGPLEDAAELISYLMFEADYCSELIALGYRDGIAMRTSIEDYFAVTKQ